MLKQTSRDETRRRIHGRLRTTLRGSASRPRLNVFRSLNHIYAQLVDDATGQTLVTASSVDKEVRAGAKNGGNVAAAKTVGKALAGRAQTAGIKQVVFDRGGYAYHGRVKALAETAREAGLEF
ncbi:MAG TPA: 50S ribosomal protein L18 [Terriglobia bacterium]|jgi:large subunit ribosomal protein L18|nr:50S ribosomal protein L18 [Terriglobia bacterium]